MGVNKEEESKAPDLHEILKDHINVLPPGLKTQVEKILQPPIEATPKMEALTLKVTAGHLRDLTQGCSWLPLPPCLPSFVSLHDLHSGLLLASAAALSPFMCLSCVISFLACSWLPLQPCLPSFVSLPDLHFGLLLAAALSPFMISILGCSWLPLPLPPCLP